MKCAVCNYEKRTVSISGKGDMQCPNKCGQMKSQFTNKGIMGNLTYILNIMGTLSNAKVVDLDLKETIELEIIPRLRELKSKIGFEKVDLSSLFKEAEEERKKPAICYFGDQKVVKKVRVPRGRHY